MCELVIWKTKIRSTSDIWEHQMIILCGEKQNFECMGTCFSMSLNDKKDTEWWYQAMNLNPRGLKMRDRGSAYSKVGIIPVCDNNLSSIHPQYLIVTKKYI